jgi:hypothetical protein
MLRNKIILISSVAILFIAITTIGQNSLVKKNKSWKNINIDSLVKITTEKNEKAIKKRIGTLKNAEKAADSLSSVVTVLKKENQQLHQTISNSTVSDSADKFELLPISED